MARLIGGTWYPSNARGNGSTDDGAAINAAKTRADDYSTFGLIGGRVYLIRQTIAVDKDGMKFDGHNATLKSPSSGSFTGGEMVSGGYAPASTSSAADRIFQEICSLVIDFNSWGSHPRGVGTYEGTGGATPVDAINKNLKIHDILFRNHSNSSSPCVYLRNGENLCLVYNIKIPAISASAIGIHIIDLANGSSTAVAANHGNTDVSHCRVSLNSASVGYKFEGSIGDSASSRDPINRVKASYLQAFRASKAPSDTCIGYYLAPGDGGGAQNSRHWLFHGITAEDLATSMHMERTTSSSGVFGFDVGQFGFEDKQGTSAGWTVTRYGIKIASAGFTGNFHHGNLFAQGGETNAARHMAFDVTGMGTDDAINVDTVGFFVRSGSLYLFPFNGHIGKKHLNIRNCPGYNPVSVSKDDVANPTGTWTPMTRPFADNSDNTDTGIYNPKYAINSSGVVGAESNELWNATDGQSTPVSGVPYTVYQTPKRFILKEAGATFSSIEVNGVDIHDTAVSNYCLTLFPYETLEVTGTSLGSMTASVFCL